MSYQVLARKWRPHNFSEMMGQEHILRALINALDQQRLHHAYLFTGTRGVGKTTIARILAKCLNCEKGISSQACNQCASCIEIDEGRFVDLIEVDAASRTKVEDTRELLDNVQYAPTRGRFKIYLIDEVHMLSGHSFNALLKTLEEPPEHVKFLLATTDPQKLPITVLSRCLQFNLKALPAELITKHLTYILDQEKINADEEALDNVARAANGSMRDALSLLDQAIAFSQGDINNADVCAMLGTIEKTHLEALLLALATQDGQQCLNIINQLAEQAPDFHQVLDELISALHHIAIAQIVPEATQQTLAKKFADQFSQQDIQLYYQIALIGKRDIAYAPDAKSGFEMIMLRMLAFHAASFDNVKQTTPATTIQRSTPSFKPAAKTPTVDASQHDDPWHQLVAELPLSGVTRMLANNCVLKSMDDQQISLSLAPQHAAMLNDKQKSRIVEALNQHLSKTIQLNISIETPNALSPAKKQQAVASKRQTESEQSIESDPNVKDLMATFGAKIQQTTPLDD